ncbi:MAG: hypothetical protein IPH07_15670 [Deltaproteobacteria bacterium]|nr:hypothetical protein [Deltaproteobacteria bacterium]MBK8719712.1 hypothetical protein [Deltaproteobacteria bacterium]MBP7288674.1 hypothetical protein [Nannocystaceae bacterium]
MREVDTGEVALVRYPVPDGLRERGGRLARWMRLVGLVQAACAGLALAIMVVSAGVFVQLRYDGADGLVLAMWVVMLLLLFRQGLGLQSAAEHLIDIGEEADDAHDHLQLAFSRLRSVFVLDLALGVLMLVRNAVALGWS